MDLMKPLQVIVMGVSGCGKSTIGRLLADRLLLEFVDGDDLHPEPNRVKMASGIPLDDDDRGPWLDVVGKRLLQEAPAPRGVVIACSALKIAYRDRIRFFAPSVFFVHLHGSKGVLLERLLNRKDHFFKASMLDSQVAILEFLADDESGISLDIELPADRLLAEATGRLIATLDNSGPPAA